MANPALRNSESVGGEARAFALARCSTGVSLDGGGVGVGAAAVALGVAGGVASGDVEPG